MARVRVQYLGDRDSVEVQVGLQFLTVAIGDVVDVPGAVAEGLLAQPERWAEAPPEPPRAPSRRKTTTNEE